MAAAKILTTSDFVGKYSISDNQYSDFDTFLRDDVEAHWVRQILGVAEGNAFLADLVAGQPQDAKYVTIFEPLNFEVNNYPLYSVGVREILLQLFYSQYTRQQAIFNATNGNNTLSSEAATANHIKTVVIHNEAVSNVKWLQCYMSDNNDVYTLFDGVYLREFNYESIV